MRKNRTQGVNAMMNNHRPHARFSVIDGWECQQCGHNNSNAVHVCQGRICIDAREQVAVMAAERRVATSRYAAAKGIKPLPAEEHGDWHDFLPEASDD